ncbi:MAG TPA: ABC transporter ATP-binding protein [Allosphingosinicella sp.]|nr:ABC transporter ATP-binding protein [Allosphingosinicella sp.]
MMLEATGLSLPGRLFDVSLRIAAGELVGLVGPNGSGKTSLLHAIAGIGSPRGEVRVDGIDPSLLGPDERRRMLAYLPAARDAAWPISARDAIALGLPASAPPEAIEPILGALDLAGIVERRIDCLSTGERSRVLIARALVARPRLLLLDEPVANLDPLWQLRLMETLRAAVDQLGQGVVVAMHDLDLAARYADRLVLIDGGAIVAEGEPQAMLASPSLEAVFGIERVAGIWRPLNRPEDRRSSP